MQQQNKSSISEAKLVLANNVNCVNIKSVPYTIPAKTERNNLILKLHGEGQSLNELSKQFGVTSQRIFQIIKRAKELLAKELMEDRGDDSGLDYQPKE